jgi:hypothetical protein
MSAPTAASAADTDVVNIPDANLKAGLNRVIPGHTPTSDITVAEAATVTRVADFPGGVADLTGMQAFTNLQQFHDEAFGNTFTDLSPLSGLTQLKLVEVFNDDALTSDDLAPLATLPALQIVALFNAPITDVSPLGGLTNLTSLQLSGNQISDISPLSGLTKLTDLGVGNNRVSDVSPLSGLTNLSTLGLSGNQISDISPLSKLTNLTRLSLDHNRIRDLNGLPAVPNALSLTLNDNQIQDPSPLVSKVSGNATNLSLNLANNLITDASSLGVLSQRSALALKGNTNLSGNRIADFSVFSGWKTLPSTFGQSIFVGPVRGNSVNVALKTDNTTTPAVSPASAGSYAAATGTLTLTDPTVASVSVTPNWMVVFANPPAPAGDPDGPTITGTTQVGKLLRVSDLGSTLTGCKTVSYRWLRDGSAFAEIPRWTLDLPIMPDANGPEMGGGGTSTITSNTFVGGSYAVSVPDLGHELSVEATCVATGVSRTSAPTPVITAAVPDQPVIQSMIGRSYYRNITGSVPEIDAETQAAVIGDPTNATLPIMVGELDASGHPVDPSGITISVTTSGVALNPAAVTITGTGAQRTISFNPIKSGFASVKFTVTGTTGLTATYALAYEAAAATTPTSRTLAGSSDASTAIDAGDGYYFIGDDEKSPIRLYNGTVSGREVAQFPVGDRVSGELDLEASARKGDMVYWFGSQGHDKDGQAAPSRNQVFQEKMSGTGANATLTPVASYQGLQNDLVDWDNTHGSPFGLAAGTAPRTQPDALNGLDLEGAEFSPDGSEMYLGMRAPVSPAAVGGKAVIFTITNFEQAFAQGTRFTFGDPILLDLGGQSIREIRKNGHNQYLIISGMAGGHGGSNFLWAWDGNPADAPQQLTTVLPQDTVKFDAGPKGEPGDWEGIAEMPDPITPGSQLRLIMDTGYDQPYGDGTDNKKNNDNLSIGRTDVFALTGAVGAVANLSDPGDFGFQTPNTIGAPKTVTVTNGGSQPLHVGRVSVAASDGVSADDFLVSTNTCSGQTIAIGASCTVNVRFAPSRDNAVSTAQLVVASDVPGGNTTVALTGTTVPATMTTATPTITGTARVGATLTAVPGDWTDGVSFSYQWLRNGTAIPGATDGSYTVVKADAKQKLSVKVTGTKLGFVTANTTSAAVTVAAGNGNGNGS